MREIVILIPDIDREQNVEIEVSINGRKKTMQYRVELIDWDGAGVPPKEKIQVLKHRIAEYDKQWELVEIGAPTAENIPLTFRRRIDNPDFDNQATKNPNNKLT